MATTSLRLLRLADVMRATGLTESPLYGQMRRGIFPRPVKIAARSVAWPAHEVDAVLAARIAGKSDDDLRELVAELEAGRARLAAA